MTHSVSVVQEVAAWEGRGAFLYNVDAGGDIAAQALTLGHLAHIWARAGLSFSLVRPGTPATCNDVLARQHSWGVESMCKPAQQCPCNVLLSKHVRACRGSVLAF